MERIIVNKKTEELFKAFTADYFSKSQCVRAYLTEYEELEKEHEILKKFSFNDFIAMLYGNYEVVATPEEVALDYYNGMKSSASKSVIKKFLRLAKIEFEGITNER